MMWPSRTWDLSIILKAFDRYPRQNTQTAMQLDVIHMYHSMFAAVNLIHIILSSAMSNFMIDRAT
jgi:hypothetical protein